MAEGAEQMQHEEISVDLTPAARPRQEVTRVLAVTESHVEEGASELVSEGADQSEHQEVSWVCACVFDVIL